MMMRGALAVLVFLVIGACGRITTRNNRLYDSQNRERIFHGVNVVMKVPPYIPELTDFNLLNSFTEKDMAYLKSWGQNVIRLGVMWPGVEPSEGKYNETYLKGMNELVEMAGKYGIYTLVEFHQDLFSEKFCADGVPMWAIPESMSRGFPLPISKPGHFDNKTGYPIGKTCMGHPWG
jgi:endoglycosylceramidase